MKNVLILCHGNINRSPLCAKIVSTAIGEMHVRQGKLAPHQRAERAAKKMRDAAAARGVDLTAHRSRNVTAEDIEWADLIIYMDGGNKKRLDPLLMHAREGTGVACLGAWAEPKVTRIPDPAFIKKGTQEYDDVVELIFSASRNLAKALIAEDEGKA